MSGHKIHAPKGVGALYLSDSLAQAFQPPYLGGEQEREKRPGTENLPYAVGLAAAVSRLSKNMKSRDTAVRALNQQLREGLKAFPEVEPVPAGGASPVTRWRPWAAARWPSTRPSGCPSVQTTPPKMWMLS